MRRHGGSCTGCVTRKIGIRGGHADGTPISYYGKFDDLFCVSKIQIDRICNKIVCVPHQRIYLTNNISKMEDGRMMLLHSAIIGVALYLFMVFVLGQRRAVAEDRSILLAALVLVYMILFGHGLPKSINKNLF